MTSSLVIGGARSGKSVHAEKLISAYPAPWIYVATAETLDAEMARRVAEHRDRRGSEWLTVEAPVELGEALRAREAADRPILVDCLTLWVSNLMHASVDVGQACDTLCEVLAQRTAPTVLVTNEVGLGIVPDNALARRFRDEAGRVNQRIAQTADRVVFMVAGLPMVVK